MLPGLNFTPQGPVDLTSTATSGGGGQYGSPIIVGNNVPNIGAILAGFMEPPERGGAGFRRTVPGFGGDAMTVFEKGAGVSTTTMLYAGGGLAIALIIWMVARRRK